MHEITSKAPADATADITTVIVAEDGRIASGLRQHRAAALAL